MTKADTKMAWRLAQGGLEIAKGEAGRGEAVLAFRLIEARMERDLEGNRGVVAMYERADGLRVIGQAGWEGVKIGYPGKPESFEPASWEDCSCSCRCALADQITARAAMLPPMKYSAAEIRRRGNLAFIIGCYAMRIAAENLGLGEFDIEPRTLEMYCSEPDPDYAGVIAVDFDLRGGGEIRACLTGFWDTGVMLACAAKRAVELAGVIEGEFVSVAAAQYEADEWGYAMAGAEGAARPCALPLAA